MTFFTRALEIEADAEKQERSSQAVAIRAAVWADENDFTRLIG